MIILKNVAFFHISIMIKERSAPISMTHPSLSAAKAQYALNILAHDSTSGAHTST